MRLVCSLFALALLAAPLAACGKKAPLKEPPRRSSEITAHPREGGELRRHALNSPFPIGRP